jgi:glycosyltransferase involved in cell wall biosynthesis
MQLVSKKILFVLESWNNAGTEHYVSGLIRFLQDYSSYEMGICILGDAEYHFPLEENIQYTLIGKSASLIQKTRILQKAVMEFAPDVCHLHIYSSLLPVISCLKIKSVEIVSTFHIPLWQWNFRHRLAWRLSFQLSDAATGVSTAVLQSFNKKWHQKEGIYLTHPPIAAELVHKKSQEASEKKSSLELTQKYLKSPLKERGAGVCLQNEKPFLHKSCSFTIIGAGRFTIQKDWPTLIKAVGKLEKMANSEIKLKIYGDGPLIREYDSLIKDLRLEQAVDLPGKVSQKDLFTNIQAADVFVLPAIFEGFGMAAIEAMALGVPTITADFEASEDFIIEGETGHRFERKNSSQLAKLLKWHYDHPGKSMQLGQKGQKYVQKNFRPEVVFKPYLEIYRR